MCSRFLGKALVLPPFAVLIGLLSTPGCALFGSEGQDGRTFQDLERVTFRLSPMGDESGPRRLQGFTSDGADSLVVQDSLRIEAGTRYAMSLQSGSPDVQSYLSTSGPPAILFYRATPSLDVALNLESISVSVQQLSSSTRGNVRLGKGGKPDDHVAESGAAAQASGPADLFRFEVATADTSVTGSLWLRLGRYRSAAAGEPDHVDFDVSLPIRVIKE